MTMTSEPTTNLLGQAQDLRPAIAEAIEQIAELPAGAQDAVREFVESAREATRIRKGRATLADIVQRVFVRSVGEFFTASRQSTQMPTDLLPYILPNPEAKPLPAPLETLDASLGAVLDGRASSRNFSKTPMTLEQLSTLLHFTAGRRDVEAGYGIKDVPLFRYPNIGGLNTVDVGIIVNRVEGLERGFYLYDPVGHGLVLKDRGDMRLIVQDMTFEADWLFHATVTVTLMHNQDKAAWKYKTRTLRFSHVDLGAIMQNFYLVSTAMGFGCCSVAGFFDDRVNDFLQLDGTRKFVSLLMGIGPKAQFGPDRAE